MNVDFRQELERKLGLDAGKEESSYTFDDQLVEYTQDIILKKKGALPKLYRYSPADYNNIRNLEKQRIYLSPAGKLNDIFEGFAGPVKWEEIKETHIKEMVDDLAYIKSFSENENDLAMWGLYADSYTGMCVEYDISEASENILYHTFPVLYAQKRIQKCDYRWKVEDVIKLHRAIQEKDFVDIKELQWLSDVVPLYLQKPMEWQQEREWRIVVSTAQMKLSMQDVVDEIDLTCAEKLYKIDEQSIDFAYAKNIYLGPRMSEEKREHIKEIGKKLGIEVHQMKLSESEYKLEIDRESQ